MDCKDAEKALLRSFDEKLDETTADLLRAHAQSCRSCARREREYGTIIALLRKDDAPEPLPYFKERLQAKLREREKEMPVLVRERWEVRAIALSLAVIFLFGAGILFFRTQEPQEWSQAETLFLRDENPLGDAASLLDQKGTEDNNMMLIFASVEDRDLPRR